MTLEYPANSGYRQPRPLTCLSQKVSYLHGSLGHCCWHILENELKGKNYNLYLCCKPEH